MKQQILVAAGTAIVLWLFFSSMHAKSTTTPIVVERTPAPPIQVIQVVGAARNNSEGKLTSPISPNLAWCSRNQWLKDFEPSHVKELEEFWVGWHSNKMAALYDMLTEYQFSPEVKAEAPCKESGMEMTYTSRTGYLLLDKDVVLDHHHLMGCPRGSKQFGNKELCGLERAFPKDSGKPCIIYSLGSNNQFEFEEAVMAHTSCTIHIFDCTSSPPRNSFGGRLVFHKKCVGRQDAKNRNLQLKMFPYVTEPEPFPNAAAQRAGIASLRAESYHALMQELGHTHIDLLKMDVEGGEYGVFADLFSRPDTSTYPDQLSFESHWWHRDITHAMLTLQMFTDLWRVGYRVVSLERQPDATCTEWTMIRVFC
eukprot:m.50580 g.50580  ORF g.50580 m.50580 type:complete len:367 (+) comp15155_c0_seq2:3-1103(+)